jgi:hydrogenase maturation protease
LNRETIVLALGNPLRGDDGAGTAVLEYLQRLDTGVTLLDGGTPGLEIVLILDGYQKAIIIDGAEMGLLPGEWRRFSPEEVRLKARDMQLRGTLHYAGLAEALLLGEALGMLPPDIIVYGIQPQIIGWTPGLSEPVQAAIELVGAAIAGELKGDGNPSLTHPMHGEGTVPTQRIVNNSG